MGAGMCEFMLLLLAVSERLRPEWTEAVAEDHVCLRFSAGNPHLSKVSSCVEPFDLHIFEAASRPDSSTYLSSFSARFPEKPLPGILKAERFHELFSLSTGKRPADLTGVRP